MRLSKVSKGGASVQYDISADFEDFPYIDAHVYHKINISEKQYVNVEHFAFLVSADEVDNQNINNYGSYIAGKDIPAGTYKIKSLDIMYYDNDGAGYELDGGYQIDSEWNGSYQKGASLYSGDSYIKIAEGQCLSIRNASIECVEKADESASTSDSDSSDITPPAQQDTVATEVPKNAAYTYDIERIADSLSQKLGVSVSDQVKQEEENSLVIGYLVKYEDRSSFYLMCNPNNDGKTTIMITPKSLDGEHEAQDLLDVYSDLVQAVDDTLTASDAYGAVIAAEQQDSYEKNGIVYEIDSSSFIFKIEYP